MDARRTSAPLDTAAKLGVLPLAKAKSHLRLRSNVDDDDVTDYVAAAFDWLHGPSGYLNGYQVLAEDFVLDAPLPRTHSSIELPLRPVIESTVVVMRQQASDGAWIALNPVAYRVITRDEVTHVWPSRTILQAYDMRAGSLLRIAFRAGHTPSEVPAGIRQAMKLLVGHSYKNREATKTSGNATVVSEELQLGVKSLVGRLRHAADHS